MNCLALSGHEQETKPRSRVWLARFHVPSLVPAFEVALPHLETTAVPEPPGAGPAQHPSATGAPLAPPPQPQAPLLPALPSEAKQSRPFPGGEAPSPQPSPFCSPLLGKWIPPSTDVCREPCLVLGRGVGTGHGPAHACSLFLASRLASLNLLLHDTPERKQPSGPKKPPPQTVIALLGVPHLRLASFILGARGLPASPLLGLEGGELAGTPTSGPGGGQAGPEPRTEAEAEAERLSRRRAIKDQGWPRPENLQKNWLREFYQIVHTHKPHFMALHCQEFGGKNYEASMSHVDKFVKELLSSDAMKEYNRARVYLDENYKSQEHFTALGSFYFLHETLKNIHQFDFKAKKYKKVTGKEIYSDTLESTPMLEKEKFPQDYFPECKWSRKGFLRTRWCISDCAFDLVNIHLFHDASNLIAWETSPSVYSGIRHKALGYVLDRIIDQRFEKAAYFVFGDFNFRLDSRSVVETLCTKATMQTIRAADTNEVVKLIFRESDNDRKVMLQLEKKLFDYFNQEVFRDNNGTALLEFDKELSGFKDKLYELDISFPPSYPYSEDSSQGKQYMNTRCPAWCDRILMSPSAKELVLRVSTTR
ncbi:inositol polyphosphate-5-phosphatase A [Gracilinanus agilis]|uniref:inositol polyphosphate-5-phosphatase A n=1 Tax=Gracilinanus agilis TaxID=191870 RepID=UPI001CFEC391|nr:inositol polyphosphate-5-phosphatase A [Gracilinanus agilis]